MDARDRIDLKEMVAGRGAVSLGLLARVLTEVLKGHEDLAGRVTALENVPTPAPSPGAGDDRRPRARA